MNRDCPTASYKTSCEFGYHNLVFGHGPAVVSLISCSLSILGSIITILPYILWRDTRTGIRRIITFLAIADLFTAIGYIMGNINYYSYMTSAGRGDINACSRFDQICQIQSYISSWSSYSSFWWTSILALYLYWTVVKGEIKKGERFFPLYHILSWGSPILVMFPLLMTRSLGYSLIAAGGWCFIRDAFVQDPHLNASHLNGDITIKILAGGKAFEIGTYIWVIVIYGAIQWNIKRKKNSPLMRNGIGSLLKQVERKLYFIPAAFILVRMWGTVQFIVSVFLFNFGYVGSNGCVRHSVYYLYYTLAILQCFGDGAQGWVNSILYIFWSPKIRQRLIIDPLIVCCYGMENHLSPTTDHLSHTLSPVSTQRVGTPGSNISCGIQEPGLINPEVGGGEENSTFMDTLSHTDSTTGAEERMPLLQSSDMN